MPRSVLLHQHAGDLYAPTRKFYTSLGYAEEARLADFYAPGDDKVIYGMRL